MTSLKDIPNLSDDKTKEAFYKDVVELYESKLVVLANNMLKDEGLARDTVQESFISFFNSIDKFEGKSSIYTFLYRIVINKSIDMLRKIKSRQKMSDEIKNRSIMTKSHISYDVADNSDIKILVGEALSKLPEKYRMPVVLVEKERLSYKEIAKILDISEGSVKTRVFRGREMLLKVFNNMGVHL